MCLQPSGSVGLRNHRPIPCVQFEAIRGGSRWDLRAHSDITGPFRSLSQMAFPWLVPCLALTVAKRPQARAHAERT